MSKYVVERRIETMGSSTRKRQVIRTCVCMPNNVMLNHWRWHKGAQWDAGGMKKLGTVGLRDADHHTETIRNLTVRIEVQVTFKVYRIVWWFWLKHDPTMELLVKNMPFKKAMDGLLNLES